jgi:crossover junction endodeoxyribonuclease RusA
MSLSFFVHGKPQSAGSKRAFIRGGRAVVTDDNPRAKPWQARVEEAALKAVDGNKPLEGPLAVTFAFTERRPKAHLRVAGDLNKTGRRNPYPAKQPDALKLARAVEDALTGIVYFDDRQIVDEHLSKRYGDLDGVQVTVEELSSYIPTAEDVSP